MTTRSEKSHVLQPVLTPSLIPHHHPHWKNSVNVCCVVLMCWDSLVTLRPLPAAQPESSQQLVPAQENKRTQSEKRKNDEEEDQQPVSERRVFIWRGQTGFTLTSLTLYCLDTPHPFKHHRRRGHENKQEVLWIPEIARMFEGDCTVPGGPTVHAASVTFDVTERWLPAVLTVTVLVAVTHLRHRHR